MICIKSQWLQSFHRSCSKGIITVRSCGSVLWEYSINATFIYSFLSNEIPTRNSCIIFHFLMVVCNVIIYKQLHLLRHPGYSLCSMQTKIIHFSIHKPNWIVEISGTIFPLYALGKGINESFLVLCPLTSHLDLPCSPLFIIIGLK